MGEKPEVVTPGVPSKMIEQAVDKGADLEKLEKLLTLQERWEANEAKKAYHFAMAEFKTQPPKIKKDKRVGYDTSKGKVGYAHASLFNVTEKINGELSKYGLSASWVTKQNNGTISVTCRITHVKGHAEETTLTAGADQSGSKNAIQAIGSTVTYLQRYTLLALTGLATFDQDDDGQKSEPIKDPQPIKKKDELATPYFEMLGKFKKAKEALGKDEYYRILGQEGFEKSNEISTVALGNSILEKMRKRVIELNKEKK